MFYVQVGDVLRKSVKALALSGCKEVFRFFLSFASRISASSCELFVFPALCSASAVAAVVEVRVVDVVVVVVVLLVYSENRRASSECMASVIKSCRTVFLFCPCGTSLSCVIIQRGPLCFTTIIVSHGNLSAVTITESS